MTSKWMAIGAVLGGLGVIMGAFGAHALSERLDAKMLAVYHTGAQYQMYHALALVALGAWLGARPELAASGWATFAGWAFTIGVVLFSGSLYALAISGVRILGAITPLGGLSFILGWAALAVLAFSKAKGA